MQELTKIILTEMRENFAGKTMLLLYFRRLFFDIAQFLLWIISITNHYDYHILRRSGRW